MALEKKKGLKNAAATHGPSEDSDEVRGAARLSQFDEAKKRWISDDTDAMLLSMAALPDDQVAAAKDWECLRHLYFTDRLSEFWRRWISEGEEAALKRFREPLPTPNEVSYRAPFRFPRALRLDSFPNKAWSELSEGEQAMVEWGFGTFTKKPVEAVRATCSQFSGLMEWAYLQWEAKKMSPDIKNPAAELLSTSIMERNVSGDGTRTQVVLEIDWKAGKDEIVAAFRSVIESKWAKENEKGRKPREKDPKHFFKGLVVLRRRKVRQPVLPWKEATMLRTSTFIFGKKTRGDTTAARTAVTDASDTLASFNRRLESEKASLCEGRDMKTLLQKWFEERESSTRSVSIPISV